MRYRKSGRALAGRALPRPPFFRPSPPPPFRRIQREQSQREMTKQFSSSELTATCAPPPEPAPDRSVPLSLPPSVRPLALLAAPLLAGSLSCSRPPSPLSLPHSRSRITVLPAAKLCHGDRPTDRFRHSNPLHCDHNMGAYDMQKKGSPFGYTTKRNSHWAKASAVTEPKNDINND